MTDEKIIEEIAESEAEQTLDAIKDLETIEEEIVEEATASVEDDDKLGDEAAAAAAAGTAFDFKQAEAETESIAEELAE